MVIAAKFEDGVFKPLREVSLKEGTLVEVYLPFSKMPVGQKRSIRDSGIFGIWAGRDDIVDGVSYVNILRDNPRKTLHPGSD